MFSPVRPLDSGALHRGPLSHSREEINGRIGVVTEKRLELSILQKQLSDLEDELRRSGGPPGWSR